MIRNVYLSGTLAIPLSELTPEWLSYLKSIMTRWTGEKFAHFYIEHDGWLHLPRGVLSMMSWMFPQAAIHDMRSWGHVLPAAVRAHGIQWGAPPFPPGQGNFIGQMTVQATMGLGGIATAPTRSGKTLCSLEAAVRLGGSTLVLVNNSELMKQWRRDIEKVFRSPCGIIKQDQFDFGPQPAVTGHKIAEPMRQ